MALDSIAPELGIRSHEEKKQERDAELPSVGRIQTKANRTGRERAAITDELLGEYVDEALGRTRTEYRKKGRDTKKTLS
jgi:hypothetical protein